MNLERLDRVLVFFAPLFLGLLTLDQISKWWALRTLDSVESEFAPKFGFHLTMNDGVAFGIDLPQWTIWILSFGVLALAIGIIIESKRWQDHWHLTGMAFLLAGAVGNMIDRARLGQVVDFIKVYWWPTFNLADAFIVVGVIILAWEILVREEAGSEL